MALMVIKYIQFSSWKNIVKKQKNTLNVMK